MMIELLLFAESLPPMPPEVSFQSALLVYGPLGIFVAFIMAVIWREIPKYQSRQDKLVDAMVNQGERNTMANEKSSEALAALTKMMTHKLDPRGAADLVDHPFSSVRTNRALLAFADALVCIAHQMPTVAEKLLPHSDAVRHALLHREEFKSS